MEILGNTAAHWAILGVILLLIELTTGTFVVLFFGLSALSLALLKILGLDHLGFEIFIFAVDGALFTLGFRKKVLSRLAPQKLFLNDQAQQITLTSSIEAKSEATIQYQGTPWTAVNLTSEVLNKGQKVTVVKTEGIKLFVEPSSLSK